MSQELRRRKCPLKFMAGKISLTKPSTRIGLDCDSNDHMQLVPGESRIWFGWFPFSSQVSRTQVVSTGAHLTSAALRFPTKRRSCKKKVGRPSKGGFTRKTKRAYGGFLKGAFKKRGSSRGGGGGSPLLEKEPIKISQGHGLGPLGT